MNAKVKWVDRLELEDRMDPVKEKARGQSEAREDVRNGKLIIKTIGLRDEEWDYWDEAWKKRCNVERKGLGDVIWGGLGAYFAGYNEVSHAAIAEKFGPDIFESVRRDARTLSIEGKIRFCEEFILTNMLPLRYLESSRKTIADLQKHRDEIQ